MPRKSKPWAVIITTPNSEVRTEHRSQRSAYDLANVEREGAIAGHGTATHIRIEQWEPAGNRWALYDTAYPAEY